MVLESWSFGSISGPEHAVHRAAPASVKRLASFDLGTLPANLPRAAVAGWNMLRMRLTPSPTPGGQVLVELRFNPTHADKPGVGRGMRLSANVSSADLGPVGGSARVYAATSGGAAAQVDYIGVFDGRDLQGRE